MSFPLAYPRLLVSLPTHLSCPWLVHLASARIEVLDACHLSPCSVPRVPNKQSTTDREPCAVQGQVYSSTLPIF
ncbi:hypothetical protein B0T25DRAFT_549770 [Lasiosphaeria hispida]|uniref:Uncharacterized protein n=1 Tax=Lasiosphaeria hispida TaxID=260671 RepID=A0AAJ0HFY7_9PEZI|nr:hypothetical protein B0T25DRAFT_549770 [Lasiosphaeria hispida]